ncbi:MAG: STT3 domain-containing protein, partial [Caulobacteraceae bacterium]
MVESDEVRIAGAPFGDRRAAPGPSRGLDWLAGRSALFLAAAFVTALVWLSLCLHMDRINGILGDTDDAMRLVLVRSLLHGKGWWDQLVSRLQPPFGSYMQWSRLLTGAEAIALWIANQLAPAGRAEWAMRFFWPLALIPAGVVSALAAARRLGGPAALVPAALLLLLDPNLYVQFIPGRLDHHNLQIVLAVAAFACAIARRDREKWAAASGVLSGLGLAIGLEALFFHALIGVFFALRLVADPREARTARAYGVGLATSTLVFFCVQTPPWRWGLSFCDALALNTVVAVIVAGGGLALVAWAAQRKGARFGGLARGASIVVVGALAGGAFLALDPSCLSGPFEAVD